MAIGTQFFHSMNVQAFSRLDGEIASLQSQVSDGKNDPRASVDPVRAARLSATNDQKALLNRYENNLDRADSRLSLTDSTLGDVSNVMQRLNEIAVRGGSTAMTPSERSALRVEVQELRRLMVDLANTGDESGRPLFSGFRVDANPFRDTGEGVVYHGDGGQHRLQVSESAKIVTGLNGQEVFGSITDEQGRQRDLFGMVDDLVRTLANDGSNLAESVQTENSMSLNFNLTRAPETWSMRVEGPSGGADISMSLMAGAPQEAVDAINAKSAETGVSASIADDGVSVALSAQGGITVSDVATEPDRAGVLIEAQDSDGTNIPLVGPGRSAGSLVGQMQTALDHVADKRAEAGSLGASVDRHRTSLDERMRTIDKAIAGLEDLDIAAAVTKLQQLLLNRDVSQQTYVKIGTKSLFDYIR